MSVENTNLTVQTDAEGQFILQPAPVGHVMLIANGSTAQRPGVWPTLEYELVTVAGQDNTVGMPIFLLPIDIPNGLFVDETTGGTLTLPEVPGFSMTIAPGSATFPDDSKSGVVSVTVVHADKIPMTPAFGQQPRFIITIQPAGVKFEPPAAITFPNLDGLAPGTVTELYSFDHDMGQFVAIGTGTVSEDGTIIRSDPGVGIIKGGWHCGGNPAPTGSCCDCGDCFRCSNNQCVADDSQTPSQDGLGPPVRPFDGLNFVLPGIDLGYVTLSPLSVTVSLNLNRTRVCCNGPKENLQDDGQGFIFAEIGPEPIEFPVFGKLAKLVDAICVESEQYWTVLDCSAKFTITPSWRIVGTLGATADRCQGTTVWRGSGTAGGSMDMSIVGSLTIEVFGRQVLKGTISASDKLFDKSYFVEDNILKIPVENRGTVFRIDISPIPPWATPRMFKNSTVLEKSLPDL